MHISQVSIVLLETKKNMRRQENAASNCVWAANDYTWPRLLTFKEIANAGRT